jgi:flagellar protein FlaI
MAEIVLPFPVEGLEEKRKITPETSSIFPALPEDFQKVVRENPYLLVYLHLLPAEVGIPAYYHRPSRKLGENKHPNFLYGTDTQGVFIHILHDPNGVRNHYIPVEPCLIHDYSALVQRVEAKLLEIRDDLMNVPQEKDPKAQLVRYVERVTTTTDQAAPRAGMVKRFRNAGMRMAPFKVTPEEMTGIKYLYLRDKHGLGPLEPLISDPFIEDISCSGLGSVFVEHKVFKSVKSALVFKGADDLDDYVLWLAERIRKPITFRAPISDASLPDGSRINMVFGKAISRRGSNFTIRKFAGTPTSIFELVDFGSISYMMLAYLSLIIGHGMNLFVSGETASGKTTLLNAITAFIHPLAKVVSIEDTPELQVPHKNWIREVVQTTRTDDKSTAVNMFDLLRAALRQRPNEIIVGEIRGPEGNVAFQAMQTGHSVMATFHAASVEKLIQRITGNPISVPKTYVDNLNVVVLTSMVKLPSGKMGRRILGIFEIVSYDSVTDAFTFVEIFHWNESTDQFEFPGYMTSDLLENRIAKHFGARGKDKRFIYSELNRRAKILETLHREQHITDFYEVLNVLSKAQREGYF